MQCSWIKRLYTVKAKILSKLFFRFNSIFIKTPANYFVDTDMLILQFIWNDKKPRIADTILKKKSNKN